MTNIMPESKVIQVHGSKKSKAGRASMLDPVNKYIEELKPSINAQQLLNKKVSGRICMCGRVLHLNSFCSPAHAVILFEGHEIVVQFPHGDLPGIGDIIGLVGVVDDSESHSKVSVTSWKTLTKTHRSDLFNQTINVNRELKLIRDRDLRRSLDVRRKVIRATREFLDNNGYLEMDTPIILPVRDIAPVRHYSVVPSATGNHVLRICPENILKRLVVAGFDRIYEIARNFRPNDQKDGSLPEFTTVECYRAYSNYLDMIDLLERWVLYVAESVTGSHKIIINGRELDLRDPWLRIDFHSRVLTSTGIDINEYDDLHGLKCAMELAGFAVENLSSRRECFDQLAEHIESSLVSPSLLMNHPAETICVAKRHDSPQHNHLLERFEAFIGGIEIAHAFSELTDTVEQRERMRLLMQEKKANGDKSHPLDEDFLTSLDIGLPPTAGIGLGIDRLVMLLTGEPIDRVFAFPYSS